MNKQNPERAVAIKAVLAAAELTEAVRNGSQQVTALSKEDRSPVTIADYGSQAVITHFLQEAFPEYPIVAEEEGSGYEGFRSSNLSQQLHVFLEQVGHPLTDKQVIDLLQINRGSAIHSPKHWVIDPIDGTRGYLRGDQYAVALGLIEEGEVVLGLLACPALNIKECTGVLLVAEKGCGTDLYDLDGHLRGQVSVSKELEIASLRMCSSYESRHASISLLDQVSHDMGIKSELMRVDSQCKYVLVATGEVEAYVRVSPTRGYQEKVWDHAAGALIVAEAGGMVTDVRGKPLSFSHRPILEDCGGVVATHRIHHNRFVDSLEEIELIRRSLYL